MDETNKQTNKPCQDFFLSSNLCLNSLRRKIMPPSQLREAQKIRQLSSRCSSSLRFRFIFHTTQDGKRKIDFVLVFEVIQLLDPDFLEVLISSGKFPPKRRIRRMPLSVSSRKSSREPTLELLQLPRPSSESKVSKLDPRTPFSSNVPTPKTTPRFHHLSAP